MSEGSKYATDYGLVVAYIGHQLSDSTLMEKGLTIMALNPSEQGLIDALRVIWMRPVNPSAPVPAEIAPALAPVPASVPAPAPVTGEVRP
jgi:hypothetical protein